MPLSLDYTGWSKEMLVSRVASLESIVEKAGLPGQQFTDAIAEAIPALTQTECRVLVTLANGEPKSREDIHDCAYWDRSKSPAVECVDVVISGLRKKLSGSPITIKTNPGRSFQLHLQADGVVVSSPRRRGRGDALVDVLASIKAFARADGLCRFTTFEMVKASGIKSKLSLVLSALQRQKLIRIRARPTRQNPRAHWLVYVRPGARS